MDMFELLSLFVLLSVFSLGWVLGQVYFAYKLRKNIKQIAEKYGMTLSEWENTFNEVSNIQITKIQTFFTETIGNSIMLYNKDTGTFVCQGTDINELAQKAFEFNNVKVALVKHDDMDMFFVQGKVSNTLE